MGKKEFIPGKDYNRNEIIEFIIQQGWTIESKEKTGHMICLKEGERPFDLPTNPRKGTKNKIYKLIGLK